MQKAIRRQQAAALQGALRALPVCNESQVIKSSAAGGWANL